MIYILTPAGHYLNAMQIVTLNVEGIGQADQLRHEVFATLVNGDRQSLASYRGADSSRQAQATVSGLLDRLGAQVFDPRATAAGQPSAAAL